ncbi:MAG: cupredoxin domain-containing protein [Alphaproteobacteria bacterium]
MSISRTFLATALFVGMALSVSPAVADATYSLVIKDHKFIPDVLKVKAGEKIRLTVRNEDPTAEEFESHDLQREKIIPPNGEIVVVLRPLKPGTYAFFGEFNPATAQGKIIAE